jgi:hypothetical protein
MERRHFLKLAFGVATGAVALATAAQAAPLVSQPIDGPCCPAAKSDARPAVVSGDEVKDLKLEQVGWRHRRWHRRHWGWPRRHWGWRRRHWRRW